MFLVTYHAESHSGWSSQHFFTSKQYSPENFYLTCCTDENPRSSAPPLPLLLLEQATVPPPHSPPSAYSLASQPMPQGAREMGESYSWFLGQSLVQRTQQLVSDGQAVTVQCSHPDPNAPLVYLPHDACRPSSGLDMPQALVPFMFHNIPTHSTGYPSTPSSGPDSSVIQNSLLKEHLCSFLQHQIDTAVLAVPLHSGQSPLPVGSS